ncbi:MAG: winged helix-turn-helix transcriptional regulator [Gammaproteobacteria bacterium]|nr:winged helix-turn-helix transcriptional regulator [Gammaproteobacteria bacterium]MCP5200994.1 winged helix-turn-helix transcriptional regulator [Gammaproteobacteria bacterium]
MKKEREHDAALTLGILEAIETRSEVTQRHLASELGVALGLANSYLRRCVRKGLVKITQAPANRYAYYLTPKGFAEKSRLTAEYLVSSLDYYHRAGASLRRSLAAIEDAGQGKVLLVGVSELAEIASVRAHDFDLGIVGTLDLGTASPQFVGRPVWHSLDEADAFDAALFTDLAATPANRRAVAGIAAAGKLYVPDIIESIVERAVAE